MEAGEGLYVILECLGRKEVELRQSVPSWGLPSMPDQASSAPCPRPRPDSLAMASMSTLSLFTMERGSNEE